MKETMKENWVAKQKGPLLPGLCHYVPSVLLVSWQNSENSQWCSTWRKENLVGVIIFFQNARKTNGWEKLVIPRKTDWVDSLREWREALYPHRNQIPKESLTRKEQTLQPGNWCETRHCIKSPKKEQSLGIQTALHLIRVSLPSFITSG